MFVYYKKMILLLCRICPTTFRFFLFFGKAVWTLSIRCETGDVRWE